MMRIPSAATQLGKIAAEAAAGTAAAAKPNTAAAQTALNASPLQARPSRIGTQAVLHPPRKQLGDLSAMAGRPQVPSAAQQLAQMHSASHTGLKPMPLHARPHLQSAGQLFAQAHHAPPAAHAAPQAPVGTPPHGAANRPGAAAVLQSLLPGGPAFPPAEQPPVHHPAGNAPDGAAVLQSLLPGGPAFAPAEQPPVHHPAGNAPDAAALFQGLLPGGPAFAPPEQPPVHHAAGPAPEAAAALFQGLLPGGPTFQPAAQPFVPSHMPVPPMAHVVQQPIHIDPQSFAPAHAPAHAAPAQFAAPMAAGRLADDRFAAERLPANAPPPSARFQKTIGMMAQYDGEQTGKVWGTKVAYLDEQQRQQFKLTVQDGKIYNAKGELFDTGSAATVLGGGKAIFVMDHDGNMYASTSHAVGKFHHSSFLAGQPVAAAGEIEVHNGQVTVVNRKSGHYRPTESQLNQVAEHLGSMGVFNFAIDQKV